MTTRPLRPGSHSAFLADLLRAFGPCQPSLLAKMMGEPPRLVSARLSYLQRRPMSGVHRPAPGMWAA